MFPCGCFWSRLNYGPGAIPEKRRCRREYKQPETTETKKRKEQLVVSVLAMKHECDKLRCFEAWVRKIWSSCICGWETEAEKYYFIPIFMVSLFNLGKCSTCSLLKLYMYNYHHRINLNDKKRRELYHFHFTQIKTQLMYSLKILRKLHSDKKKITHVDVLYFSVALLQVLSSHLAGPSEPLVLNHIVP